MLKNSPAVIPGRAEGANPESRRAGNPDVTGFRARRFAASRNDDGGFFSSLLEQSCQRVTAVFAPIMPGVPMLAGFRQRPI
jgi:hypothetical protein